MPSHAGYEPIAGDDDADISRPSLDSQDGSVTGRRRRGPSVDLKGLDTAFKRWTETIAQRVKINRRKKLEIQPEKREIVFSVFQPAHGRLPPPPTKTLDHQPPITHEEFERIAQSVRAAIFEGIHPKMISKGSSGSYYARVRDPDTGQIKTIGVFKPKDEECPTDLKFPNHAKPQVSEMGTQDFLLVDRCVGSFSQQEARSSTILGFGRSCLIPNLSYISEAGASLLDTRLSLHIVPHTELASFASPAFFYDWIDRSAAKKGKALPEKIGSLQLFTHGFTDASDFLRKHPWPGRSIADTWNEDDHRQGRHSKRCFNALGVLCGKAGGDYDDYDDMDYDQNLHATTNTSTRAGGSFVWTPALQQSFREELEKLIILDYLMRNTDRGLDNFMIKYCEGAHEKQIVDTAPTRLPMMSELKQSGAPSHVPHNTPGTESTASPYSRPHIHIAAIDNSLSFPHHHPKGWRSYTYGWLFLPVSLIGRPFSEKTRNHFLPLLSSSEWWAETTFQLRKLFSLDPDFNQRMFDRQMAVLKGQGWNIVQSLKRDEEGPLELTRRVKVLVWDDEVEVINETVDAEDGGAAPLPAQSPKSPRSPVVAPTRQSVSPLSFAMPRRRRSRSISDFPPPRPRAPVPFTQAVGTSSGETSGVAILAQLEKLDEVSSGREDAVATEEVEITTTDVFRSDQASDKNPDAVLSRPGPSRISPVPEHDEGETALPPPHPSRIASDPIPLVQEDLDGEDDEVNPMMFSSVTSLGDNTPIPPSMTRSATAAQGPRPSLEGRRWPSFGAIGKRGQRLSLDTATATDVVSGKTRTVIRERLQTVDSKAFFQNW
ncbi:phosphatidylinositol 3- and 4-kinase [Rhizoctonia solani]|uniref:Phosphatidylinositol 4-kinase n=1 Tax=Rhizoctonia solani TaxID=456999 RepID=A0A8H8SX17_9AGAM|nr:phosphatidylinositol 3- and 4-kinase [Rhizoctonia solani]QRW21626.1 phosphatidylinositol 3- and 4-kinase [Rhizoctonia solani]